MDTASGEPRLLTERLELWLPQVEDLQPLYDIVSNEQTARYLGGVSSMADQFMRFMRNAGSWHLYGYGMFMVRERGGDGSLIGNCGIFHSIRGLGSDFDDRAEAGWIFGEGCTGKGYGGEAMRAVFDWFDAEFDREVVCLIATGNAPSFSLAGKLGFAPMRDAQMPDGDTVTLLRRPPPSGV